VWERDLLNKQKPKKRDKGRVVGGQTGDKRKHNKDHGFPKGKVGVNGAVKSRAHTGKIGERRTSTPKKTTMCKNMPCQEGKETEKMDRPRLKKSACRRTKGSKGK